MCFVVPYVSEVTLLQYIVAQVNAGSPVLHLFSNNITPNPGTTEPNTALGPTDLSVGGYTPVTCTNTAWTVATTSGTSTATYPTVTFSFSTSCTVYGYYLSDSSGGNMLLLEAFTDGPYVIPSGGGQITVTPQMALTYNC